MTDVQETLRITRTLDVPRERVWRAWTQPEELAQWWWPERFQTTYQVDLREGAQYRFRTANLPDLGVLSLTGRFLEVYPPERLVYTWQWENGDERPTRVSVDLEERDARTEIHLTHEGFADNQERENHVLGWTHCLDRLQTCLAG